MSPSQLTAGAKSQSHQTSRSRLWAMRKDRPQATEDRSAVRLSAGARLDYANVYNRILKPAMRKAVCT